MVISTVLTHADWLRVLGAWTLALRRFDMECDWEILQISDSGSMRKFTLKVNKHEDHESLEVEVQVRLVGTEENAETVWSASRRCVRLPSCEVKYIEETNSRSGAVTRYTPDDPMPIGSSM